MLVIAASVVGGGVALAAPPPPWQRTEAHEPCAGFNALRNPYFGDLHVHTTNSIDAVVFNTLNAPRDAYRFANGEPIGLAPYDVQGNPARTIRLGRRLDFAAVTDHAEGFGAQSVCFLSGLPGYDSSACRVARQAALSADPDVVAQVFRTFLLPAATAIVPGLPEAVCGPAPAYADCASRQSLFWLEAQAAAEEFYDRSAACAFTSFVGYEWTGTPAASNLHRNVIFRNAVVPELPVTYIEQQQPEKLWAALKAKCQDALAGCDWLAIPHNSNLSGPEGRMFLPENADPSPARFFDVHWIPSLVVRVWMPAFIRRMFLSENRSPLTAADAATRAAMEPLVEIYQHKGSSECRPGVDSIDEQCGFELMQANVLQGKRDPSQTFGRLSFVRNALKEGLVQEQLLGANPFRLGIIGSTDTHNGSPGYTSENNWFGHSGVNDDTPENGMLNLTGRGRGENSPGGLAAVWAEENSRDALFSAMRRRETYGTSGPRHVVRFFAGTYAEEICQDGEFAANGYRQGVPMGAEMGPIRGDASPVFAVLAMKDPGDHNLAGTPLQRIQIIKGWVDENGTGQEKVFEVAGDANNGAEVDVSTCTPMGTGFDTLCTTWKDPEFKRDQRAFYYARVLENPSCRWSTHVCNRYGIDCSMPGSVPAAFAICCDQTRSKTIQERSWSSPIWYRPEGLAGVEAEITYGKRVGTDRLKLTAQLGAGAVRDLTTQDLRVVVRDDDDIVDVTIPAGSMRGGRVENFAGLEHAEFEQEGSGVATLELQTVPGNLARADRVDHMVEVKIHIGETFVVSQSRLWTFDGEKLHTQ